MSTLSSSAPNLSYSHSPTTTLPTTPLPNLNLSSTSNNSMMVDGVCGAVGGQAVDTVDTTVSTFLPSPTPTLPRYPPLLLLPPLCRYPQRARKGVNRLGY